MKSKHLIAKLVRNKIKPDTLKLTINRFHTVGSES